MKINMADSQKLKLVLSYDLAVPLLEMFLKVYIPLHTDNQRDICKETTMTKAWKWNQVHELMYKW